MSRPQEISDLIQSASELRGRSLTCIPWMVEKTSWVDLSAIRSDLSPFFQADVYKEGTNHLERIAEIEAISPHGTRHMITILCGGKSRLLFKCQDVVYVRRGPYQAVNPDKYLAESLHVASIITTIAAGEPDAARTHIRYLRQSASLP